MLSYLSALLFRWWGWKATGRYPHEVPKVVLIVAPHTSNWDFPVGVLVRSACKINAYFVAKHTIFWGPLGPLMRWMNGIPVDRRAKGNFVAATADLFKQRDYLHIVIAPEGTRTKVDKFKSGFYHTAKMAGVPIVLCKFDWEHREVYFDPELFYPTDNEKADLDYLWNYYKQVKGYNPEQGIQ